MWRSPESCGTRRTSARSAVSKPSTGLPAAAAAAGPAATGLATRADRRARFSTLVVQGVVGLGLPPQHSQTGAHGVSAQGRHGADQQVPGLAPGADIEQRREGRQQRYNGIRWAGQNEPNRDKRFILPSLLSLPKHDVKFVQSSV